MSLTIAEIARIVGGELVGPPDMKIDGASGIREAKPGEISFVGNAKYSHLVETTQASCLIVSKNMNGSTTIPCIRVEDPSLAFAKVVEHFCPDQKPKHPSGIHPTAIIEENARIGENVSIGPHAVIGEDVQIGDNTVIYPNVVVGQGTQIGADSLIYANVSIRERVLIGKRVIIHSGAVIGSDGFGFATIQGIHHKIPQVGTVVVHDDVEIGANVTVDRARFGKTVIGRGTKIDNLVQIAHNVEIGEGTIIIAQAGVSGSTKIGKNVILAGQAGIIGHLNIGDNVVVAAGAGVIKSVESNQIVLGSPAKPHQIAKRIFACIDKLPDLFKKIAGFEKRIEKIERDNEWKSKPPLKNTLE